MSAGDVFALAGMMQQHPLLGNRASFRYADVFLMSSQFHLRILDPDTGRPHINSPLWDKSRQFIEKIAEVYQNDRSETSGSSFHSFADGRVAMFAGRFHGDSTYNTNASITRMPAASHSAHRTATGIWPLFPSMPTPRSGPAPAYYYLVIPKNSQKKPEAFQLIAHLLSDEVQLADSRLGVASILSDPFWIESFGADLSHFHGKRVRSFFHHSKEGSLDLDFDWQMQRAGYRLLEEERGWMMDYLNYRREKLEKVGVVEGAHLER